MTLRRDWICRSNSALDVSQKISLHALQLIHSQNCFRKSGFHIPAELLVSDEPDISVEIPDAISVTVNGEAFVDINDKISICDSQVDDLSKVIGMFNQNLPGYNEENFEAPPAVISHASVKSSINDLYLYSVFSYRLVSYRRSQTAESQIAYTI